MKTLAIVIVALIATTASVWADAYDALNQAVQAQRDGKYEVAIESYNLAIESNEITGSNLSTAYRNRGTCYRMLRNPERAIQDYDQAILLNPKSYGAYRGRSSAYKDLGEYQLALNDISAAMTLSPPKVTWDILSRAAIYIDAGQFELALDDIEWAFQFDEDGPGTGPGMAAQFHLGQALHELGRYEEAVDAYTNGIPKQSDFQTVYFQRAKSHDKLGNETAAKKDLETYVRISKENFGPDALQKLTDGKVLNLLKRYDIQY